MRITKEQYEDILEFRKQKERMKKEDQARLVLELSQSFKEAVSLNEMEPSILNEEALLGLCKTILKTLNKIEKDNDYDRDLMSPGQSALFQNVHTIVHNLKDDAAI